jgi:hypothetical protein
MVNYTGMADGAAVVFDGFSWNISIADPSANGVRGTLHNVSEVVKPGRMVAHVSCGSRACAAANAAAAWLCLCTARWSWHRSLNSSQTLLIVVGAAWSTEYAAACLAALAAGDVCDVSTGISML